jgi:hypothetical protein
MKITNIDSAACRQIRTFLDQALASVATQLGIHIKVGHASYAIDGKTANFKLELSTIGADGVAVDRDAERFKSQAQWLGMKAEDLGRRFKNWDGKEYELTGYNPRASRFPFLGKEIRTGKTYKLTESTVKTGLGYGTKERVA